MKKSKKMVALVMALCMGTSLIAPASATGADDGLKEGISEVITEVSDFSGNTQDDNMIPGVEVKEVNGVRTAISSDDYAEYTISFDRNAMALSIVIKELSTGTETSTTVYASDIELMSLTRASSSVYTSSLYAYERTKSSTGTEWYLQRPKMESEGEGSYYFKCWENNSNSSELNAFKVAVEDLYQKETELVAAAGALSGTMFVTGILGLFISAGTAGLAAPAVAALIASIGLTGPAVIAADAVALQCNTCFEKIEDVFYATDNMHS